MTILYKHWFFNTKRDNANFKVKSSKSDDRTVTKPEKKGLKRFMISTPRNNFSE